MPNTDLPDEIKEPAADAPQEEQKLDRRTAIAQARAIRREAAALEEEAKAQANETVSMILEHAEPAPPKVPMHNKTKPVPVSNATGKFGWLDELQKPEEPEPERDPEEIVEELLATSESKPKTPVTDALVDQIVAEVTGQTPEPEQAESAAPAEEISAPQDRADTAETADTAENESAAADAEPEQPAEASDPAAAHQKSEEQVIRALRRMSTKTPSMSDVEAAKQYRKSTAEAKAEVRKMRRRFDRSWQQEAGSLRAAETKRRTERKFAGWNIAVCLVMLFGVAAGMLIFERPTVSMEENRTLAKMPEISVEKYLDGELTGGIAEYYNDTVPFRSTFKGWIQNLRSCFGLRSSAVIIGNAPAVQKEPDETAPAPAETTVTTAVTEFAAELTTIAETTVTESEETPAEPEREGELSNNILIVDNRGIMLFQGWETMGENYANILNRYQEQLPDVKMYSMVVPTVCSYYTPEEFQHLITSEKANIDYINSVLKGVIPVDAYGALEKHKDEPIFMRTDHHWSSLGAFYAAEAFSAAARVPFAPISDYERHAKEGYVGTLYGFSNNIILKNNPEEFFWYVPKANYTTTYYNRSFGSGYEGSLFMDIENTAPVSWYMTYISGDDHIVKIDTDMPNGRKLCVIKDSYGNALIPFLTSSFETVYVVDMRYFELNAISFLREQGVTDVLFAMNTFSANGPNTDKIETIRVQ